ncbi:hypothetical protein ES705_10389 [subsurface metagenome]
MTNHYSNILKELKTEYRALERYYGQTVYKLSKDGFVYLRYSKREKTGKERYFFGLEKDAIEKLKKFDFTVIFVCGEEDVNFMLNKDLILSIIDGLKISTGRWLINIYNIENVWYLKVSGKKKIDISDFKNRFDLIFSKIVYLEKEITKEEFREEKRKPELIELSEVEKIKSNLISSSIKSDKSSFFEEAITSYFKFLGFECEHIGGAGNTDVLVSIPYRVIIEAKTTTRGSIGRIYFTRLKQHKEKHNADYITVICNDFEPSVIKDADIENSVLIRTKILCKILDLNQEYPLSPIDLEYIFQMKGLLKEEDLQRLENRFVDVRDKVRNLPIIIKSVDSKKRNVEEIYGRYQIKCEEMDIKYLNRDEFIAFINFLSMSFINLITKENNLYYRNISEDIAIRRFNKTGGWYE